MKRLLGSILLAVAVFPSAAAAQVSEPADSVQRELRAALRVLAAAQESHYTEQRTYSADMEVLKRYVSFAIGAGVTVVIHEATAQGWSAESTHPALPGESCVYWYASPNAIGPLVTRRRKYPGHEFTGRAICDFDPLPTKRRTQPASATG
jgi:hypothetical protein